MAVDVGEGEKERVALLDVVAVLAVVAVAVALALGVRVFAPDSVAVVRAEVVEEVEPVAVGEGRVSVAVLDEVTEVSGDRVPEAVVVAVTLGVAVLVRAAAVRVPVTVMVGGAVAVADAGLDEEAVAEPLLVDDVVFVCASAADAHSKTPRKKTWRRIRKYQLKDGQGRGAVMIL